MSFAQRLFICRQLMRQYSGGLMLCSISLAFACALLMSVVAVQSQAQQAFANAGMGFNAVIGPRGSSLQLVLNSLFHLDKATGAMPWQRYLDIKSDRRVVAAYPICVGDNYHSFHMVGSTVEMFEEHEIEEGKKIGIQSGGRIFDPYRAEALVGSFVAEQLGMKVGTTFYSYHGLQFDKTQKHDLLFTVVGILEPSNTPMDRAIWIPLESYYRMPGHALYGDGKEYVPQAGVSIPAAHKEVSAVLCKIRPSSGLQLNFEINRNSKDLTFAWPLGSIIFELFESLSWVEATLSLIALMVFVISTFFIGSTLYQTMQQQQRDFTLMRALGARRFDLSMIIIYEGFILAGRSLLLTIPMYMFVLGFAAMYLRQETGVYLTLWHWHSILVVAPIILLLLTLLAAIIPALRVYGRNVGEQLQDHSQ